MKTLFLIILTTLFSQFNYGQSTIKMSIVESSKNKELYELMLFQGISVNLLTFTSPEIKDKYYQINIEEYKNGVLVRTKSLFEGNDSEYFKIDSTTTSFKFFSEIENNKLKTYIKGKRFGSRKETFSLEEGFGNYVTKNFLGINNFLDVPLKGAFPILAIITPTKHKDGSGSYCEVAQSEVTPNKYWEKFNIPHYFIITMEFK